MLNNVNKIIDGFSKPYVMVLGDTILDVYLDGDAARLSPEAPVPVVNVLREQYYLGGAANVAANLKSLGAETIYCSVCGQDEGADRAFSMLNRQGINTSCLVKDPSKETIIKARLMIHSQVLARFDKGSEKATGGETEKLLINNLRQVFPLCDAVIIADYNKGVITPSVIKALKDLYKKHPVFLAVDSKRLPAFKSLAPSMVKPNYEELISLLGLPKYIKDRRGQIKDKAKEITGITGSLLTVVTLDEEGAIAMNKNGILYEAQGQKVDHPQVIGAGDTFISAFSLASVSGASVEESMDLALAASSIAVSKDFTACCNHRELRSYFVQQKKRIHSLEELKAICEFYKYQRKKIVFTNGCFDILHSGHINYLNKAAELGDVMIVGINNDESIQRLKGPSRPINPLQDRMNVLSGLGAVDHIISFGSVEDDTPVSVIKAAMPHVVVKGGDYDITRMPEAVCVEQYGGQVKFIPLTPFQSTTRMISRIKQMNALNVSKQTAR